MSNNFSGPGWSNHLLRFTVILLFFALIVFVVVTLRNPAKIKTIEAVDVTNSHTTAVLDEVYRYRMTFHTEGTSAIRQNLKFQGLAILIAILLIAKAVQSEVNLLGVFKVSARQLAIIELMLPFGILYLWMEFGYLLFDLIDNHKILWHLIELRQQQTGISLETVSKL